MLALPGLLDVGVAATLVASRHMAKYDWAAASRSFETAFVIWRKNENFEAG